MAGFRNLFQIRESSITAVVVLPIAMVNVAHSNPMLDTLVNSYADHLAGYENGYLVWKDGTRMTVSDDRHDKTFEELLEAPDILDQFAIRYPVGKPTTGIVKRVRLPSASVPYPGCPIGAEAPF